MSNKTSSETPKKQLNLDSTKKFATKAYKALVVFACEALLAALAILGTWDIIHKGNNVQAILGVVLVLLLLAVKFNNRK